MTYRAYGARSPRSHYCVILIVTSFATELVMPTVTDVRMYECTYVRTDTLPAYYINYSNTTKNNILFIDVSASHRKPSSGLTSGAGRQYVKACPIGCVAQLVAPLVSIHVVGLPDPYRLPYESASLV